jgi:protein-tyrosine-phosphatase
MAEGWLRAKRSPRPIEVISAGEHPGTLHPAAVAAMHEQGIDISTQSSKHLDQFREQHFDLIVTVCDQVREHCPVFPGTPATIHWSTPDPALASGTPEEMAIFRRTAAQLATRVDHMLLQIDYTAAMDHTEGSH